jgi:hypothetical protein
MAILEFELRGTEEERVLFWRAEELVRAGYDDETAIELAMETDVDLHRAIALRRRGCPPRTALRILL